MHHKYAIAIDSGLPLVADYGSRAARRRRVVALYAGFTALFPSYAFAHAAHDLAGKMAWLAVVSIAFGCFCYGFYTLLQRTFINSPNVPNDAVDERQLDRRNRAVFVAYRALAMATAVVPLWLLVATTAERWGWLRDPSLLAFASWGLLLTGVTLPTAILAWSEPDPIEEA